MLRKLLAMILFRLIVLGSPALAELPELPPSHSVKPQLFATGFEFAEGPAFNAQGDLFVVNYRQKGFLGRIRQDGTAGVFADLNKLAPVAGKFSQANGLKVDRDQQILAADTRAGRVLRIASDGTRAEILTDNFEGVPYRGVNDLCLDLQGDIYFTDPAGSSRQMPIGCAYRYHQATHEVVRIASNLAFPNGIAVSPDQKHLCLAESQEYRVWIFDLGPQGVSNPRVLLQFSPTDEGDFRGGTAEPDGMIFDEHGRLYVAMYGGGVINVIDIEKGNLIRQYDAGGMNATNCHFYEESLYVTTADKEAVFRLNLGVRGFDYRGESASAETP